MIFSEEYDLALFYMLKCDVINRRKIRKFLKEMPIEAIEEIRNAIIQHNKKSDEEKLLAPTYGRYDVPDSEIGYSYSIDEDLTIQKDRTCGTSCEDEFELLLCPINKEYLKDIDEEWLGTATTEIKTLYRSEDGTLGITSEKENEYNLVKTKFGYFVVAGHNVVGDFCIPIARPVNIKKAPDDVNFKDIGISKKLSIGRKKS